MPLGRLIGLEILKLHEESNDLQAKIDEYSKVLGDKKELFKIIKKRLGEYKKAFNRPRRTLIDNVKAENYVEEVKEEEIYIFIDKFGYTKSIDSASYSRLAPETLEEFSYIVPMKNTDKLCFFTTEGNMYQINAFDIPQAKVKDKGVLIQTLTKVGKEHIILYTPFEELFESQLVFVTKNGYIKQVSGAEFETVRYTLNATKLEDDDKIVSISKLSASKVLSSDDMKIILITKNGLSLGFTLSEVSELKRNSRGVIGIRLDDGDHVDFSTIVDTNTESFIYKDKELSAKKVRKRKRAQKGHNANLEL